MGQFGADALYRALGCKLLSAPASDLPTAVLKDIATSDTLLLVRNRSLRRAPVPSHRMSPAPVLLPAAPHLPPGDSPTSLPPVA